MRGHIHEAKRLWLLVVVLFAVPAGAQGLLNGLGIEARCNYDWMGHRYRLGESDTLDIYDEKSLSAILRYGDRFGDGVWAENRAVLSDRSVKNALAVGWSSDTFDDVRWSFENRLEFKNYRWRGEDLFGSSYVQDDLNMEGSWPLSSGLRLVAKQSLSFIDYQKTTSYFRDAWLSRTTTQLLWESNLMWDMDFGYTLSLKSVPDSSGMNYHTHSFSSSFNGFIGWALRYHFDALVERRQMETGEGQPDYLDLSADIEIEYDLEIPIGLVLKGDVEQLLYNPSDEIYYDYWTATGKVGVSKNLNSEVNVTLLPIFRRSEAKGTTIGETYREIGLTLEVDYYGTGRLWGHASLEIGSRDYAKSVEETFYSNYDYVHPTLLLNVRLNDRISLDMLIDHEPEWHKQKEDDFTSSLFSSSLNYRFR